MWPLLVLCAAASAAQTPSVGDTKIIDGATWRLTWQDEFNGNELNLSNWTPLNNSTYRWFIERLFAAVDLLPSKGFI